MCRLTLGYITGLLICCLVEEGYAERVKVICPRKEIIFTVEVPQTREERMKGLMFRETLALDAGMLFLFPESGTHSPTMWMKNTILPLDMVFANEKGQILEVFENTTPYSLDPIGPAPGTTQVLEINSGLAQKHGITRACRIQKIP